VRIQKIALVETEWVLRKVYSWKKEMVIKAFEAIMGYVKVVVEEQEQVTEALTNWAVNPKSDFADCMLVAGTDSTFATFDGGLATLPRVQLLP